MKLYLQLLDKLKGLWEISLVSAALIKTLSFLSASCHWDFGKVTKWNKG
jgi:hypothetical protein